MNATDDDTADPRQRRLRWIGTRMPTTKKELLQLIDTWKVATPDDPKTLSIPDLRELLYEFDARLAKEKKDDGRNIFEKWGEWLVTFGERHKGKTYCTLR